jgi:hypothetical protein
MSCKFSWKLWQRATRWGNHQHFLNIVLEFVFASVVVRLYSHSVFLLSTSIGYTTHHYRNRPYKLEALRKESEGNATADSSQQGKVNNSTAELMLAGKAPSVRRTSNVHTKLCRSWFNSQQEERLFSLPLMCPDSLWALPSPLMGITDSLPLSKAVGAWRWSLTIIRYLEWAELCLPATYMPLS